MSIFTATITFDGTELLALRDSVHMLKNEIIEHGGLYEYVSILEVLQAKINKELQRDYDPD